MPDWTIESELLSLTATATRSEALEKLGIPATSTANVHIQTDRDWYQAGAETWVFVFSLVIDAKPLRKLILKACAPNFAPRPVAEICDDWFRTRQVLADAGIAAPHVVARQGPLWLEEFIEYDLKDAIARPSIRPSLARSIGATAGSLFRCGYVARSYHDWRTDGVDVILVDFGSDIGKIGAGIDAKMVLTQLHRAFDPVLSMPSDRTQIDLGFQYAAGNIP